MSVFVLVSYPRLDLFLMGVGGAMGVRVGSKSGVGKTFSNACAEKVTEQATGETLNRGPTRRY